MKNLLLLLFVNTRLAHQFTGLNVYHVTLNTKTWLTCCPCHRLLLSKTHEDYFHCFWQLTSLHI